jgi:hypothetical protein
MSVIGGLMVVGSQPTPNLDGIEADEVPHFEVGDSVFRDEAADVAASRVQETGQLVYGQQLVGKVYEFFGRGHRVDLLLIAGRIPAGASGPPMAVGYRGGAIDGHGDSDFLLGPAGRRTG